MAGVEFDWRAGEGMERSFSSRYTFGETFCEQAEADGQWGRQVVSTLVINFVSRWEL